MSAKDRTDAKNRHEEKSSSAKKTHSLNIFIACIAILTLSVACIGIYLQCTTIKLEQDVKGMTEYEVCQYAATHYDEEMVKNMGCLDDSHVPEK